MDGALNRSKKAVIKKSSSKKIRRRAPSIKSLKKKNSQQSLKGSARPLRMKSADLPIKPTVSKKRVIINQETNVLMNRIKDEIKELQAAVHTDEGDGVPFEANIELLGRLTTLLGLVKKYYQGLRKGSFRGEESRASRKNFEQVLVLIRKLMDKLLKKVSTDLATSQMLDKSTRGNAPEDEAELERKNRSIVRINSMRQRLTRDLQTLIPKGFPTTGDVSLGSPGMTVEENEDLEHQTHLDSISDINGLLVELAMNLNQMNHAIENQDEQDEFGHTDHNTSNTFGLMNSKTNSNNRSFSLLFITYSLLFIPYYLFCLLISVFPLYAPFQSHSKALPVCLYRK